jgi:hypothetical protein
MLEGDADLVARLIHKWEKLHHEYVSHSVSVGSTSSSTDQNKQSKSSDKDGDNPLCQ